MYSENKEFHCNAISNLRLATKSFVPYFAVFFLYFSSFLILLFAFVVIAVPERSSNVIIPFTPMENYLLCTLFALKCTEHHVRRRARARSRSLWLETRNCVHARRKSCAERIEKGQSIRSKPKRNEPEESNAAPN